MYIGKIKLADADGHLTSVGHAWLEMGGADPERYSGNLITRGESKYVIENGHRVELLKSSPRPERP